MQGQPRRRQAGAAGGGGNAFRWLLLLLLAGMVAWVWFRSGQLAPAPEPPPLEPLPPPPVELAPPPTSSPPRVVTAPPPRVIVETSSPPVVNTGAPPALQVTGAPPVVRTATPPAEVVTSPPPVLVRTSAPPALPTGFPRPVRDVLEAQIALARQGLSSGSIDGVAGSQTAAALRAFQRRAGLPASGELDAATRAALQLDSPPTRPHAITSNDLQRLQPLAATWLGKARQSALAYETVLELVAEKSQAHPRLIRQLNPRVDWSNVVAGIEVEAPDIQRMPPATRAAHLHIRLGQRLLQVLDADSALLAQFPVSIAQRVDKRPVGELRVEVIIPNPDYTFNPEIFPESAEGRRLGRKLLLRPGPNNPVGVAWIGLNRPGYGIHGTPNPEQVGRTESHGCFRLANWDAEYLLKLVWLGMPVYVER